MKKNFLLSAGICLSVLLMSWGYVGHQVIAQIAENHLTPQAKLAIKALLGKESIADVASWADEALNQPDYKNTASWHFVNVKPGLSYREFAAAVKGQGSPNVYLAIQNCKNMLTDKKQSARQRATALKFIVHLIGDAHQPMHISRGEDRGGNTVQIKFNGTPTNLHSLWDSGLLGHESLSFAQMATNYDTATPQQIKQWQSDNMMQWLYESYQISSLLYEEAEKNNEVGKAYYQDHKSTIRNRIEKAGIRLAGVLNEIFKNISTKELAQIAADTNVKSQDLAATKAPAKSIALSDLSNHIGENITVTGKVYGAKDFGGMVLVNVGAAYPDSPLTVVLRGSARQMATTIDGKNITVTGMVIKFKDKPEIEVTDTKQIVVGN